MHMKKRRNLRKNLTALILSLVFFLSSCTFVPTESGVTPSPSAKENNFPNAAETIELESGVKLTLSDDKSHYIATANEVNVEHLVIPAEYEGVPICEVSMLRFEADNVRTVSLPDTIFSIGLSSFLGCSMLKYNQYGNAYYLGNEEYPYLYLMRSVSDDITSVAIHETTRVIAGAAFSHCTELRAVYIPDSVVNIENIAFYECNNLKNVHFGEGVKRIGQKCFYDCEKLSEVILPDGIVEIGTQGFLGCPITKLDLGESVETLGEHTFDDAKIMSLEIPGSLKTIDFCAFRNCRLLTAVTIHKGVEVIGESAFVGCTELKSLYLPDTVKRIEDGAFEYCLDLKLSTLPDSVEFVHAKAFPTSISDKIYGNGIYLGNSRSEYAYLVSAVAAKNTEIELHPETEITAFWLFGILNCSKVSINNGKNLEVKNSCVINKHTGELVAGLNDAVIPDDGSVKSIGYGAFYNLKELASVTIPDSVESIGDYAFTGCQSLTEAVIGNGVVSIGKCAFQRSGLESVSFGSSVAHIGDEAFDRTRITSAVFGDSLKTIGESAFNNCSNITVLELGNSIESIGKWAFTNCGVTHLYLPSSLKELSMGSFNNCRDLKEVFIAAKVTELSNSFNQCPRLEYISIPGSVTKFSGTLRYCESLTRIDFGGNLNDWNALGIEGFANEVRVFFADSTSMVLPKIEQ